jgi:hypothetical protein
VATLESSDKKCITWANQPLLESVYVRPATFWRKGISVTRASHV